MKVDTVVKSSVDKAYSALVNGSERKIGRTIDLFMVRTGYILGLIRARKDTDLVTGLVNDRTRQYIQLPEVFSVEAGGAPDYVLLSDITCQFGSKVRFVDLNIFLVYWLDLPDKRKAIPCIAVKRINEDMQALRFYQIVSKPHRQPAHDIATAVVGKSMRVNRDRGAIYKREDAEKAIKEFCVLREAQKNLPRNGGDSVS